MNCSRSCFDRFGARLFDARRHCKSPEATLVSAARNHYSKSGAVATFLR